jgi:malonate transporter and related proteins
VSEVVDIVLPVFGLIGIGYAVAWSRLLKEATGDALADFVFTVAVPILIFRTIATVEFAGASPWRLWLVYFSAMTLAWTTGTLIVRGLFGRDARAGVVGGFSAGYGNTVLIGIPLVLTAYGEAGGVAIFLVIAVHLLLAMTASAVLIERALKADGVGESVAGPATIARSLVANLAVNPIIIGVVAALAWRLVGTELPELAATVIDRLADVASTLALFAVGMSLNNYGIAGHVLPAIALSAIKNIAMPATVLVTAFYLVPMPPVWAKAMVLAAACPTGVYISMVAARFRSGEALASSTITISTVAAIATVTFWLSVVQRF